MPNGKSFEKMCKSRSIQARIPGQGFKHAGERYQGKGSSMQASNTRAKVQACRQAIPGQGFKQAMPGQALHLLDLGHLDSCGHKDLMRSGAHGSKYFFELSYG